MDRTYEPSSYQLRMLRALPDAPRYLIIRPRAHKPVTAILPIWGDAAEQHLSALTRDNGHCGQLVRYRPEEEDLGPIAPPPIWRYMVGLAIVWAAAIWWIAQ